MDTLTIREARIAELPAIASFWMAMFEEVQILPTAQFAPDWRQRFLEYFERRIAQGEAYFSVASQDEEIVGTAGAMLLDGYPAVIHGLRFGYIFGVRVEPAFRGRRIATALTRETITFLKRLNCHRIRLHASLAGRPIYEGLGFGPTNEMQLALA